MRSSEAPNTQSPPLKRDSKGVENASKHLNNYVYHVRSYSSPPHKPMLLISAETDAPTLKNVSPNLKQPRPTRATAKFN